MIIQLNKEITIERMHKHLFPGENEPEHAIFLFGEIFESDIIKVVDAKFLDADDFEVQSSYHIHLKEETIASLIKAAHDSNTCLIEIHSHIEQKEAHFSFSDWSGFEEFVPHILWRLPNRPYIALVFAENSYDALLWTYESPEPTSITKIINGSMELKPTCKSIRGNGYRYYE